MPKKLNIAELSQTPWNDEILNDPSVSRKSRDHKWYNRKYWIYRNFKEISSLLPELQTDVNHKKSIIDIGCGNGIFLEIMSWYNYEIMGIDQFEQITREFVYSQKIPNILHDCRNLPFHILDKSYDILFCRWAIQLLYSDSHTLTNLMNEFARITKERIIILGKWPIPALCNWQNQQFHLIKNIKSTIFDWEVINNVKKKP